MTKSPLPMTQTAPLTDWNIGHWYFEFVWSRAPPAAAGGRLGHWSLVSLLMGLTLLVGCNSGSVSGIVPVSGKVTYKGAPVEGAIVTFVPEGSGRTATATTRASGVFSLTTVDSPGAMPGKYKVTVDK